MGADMRIVPGGDQLRAIRVAPALVSSNGVTEVLTIVRFATLSDGAFYAPSMVADDTRMPFPPRNDSSSRKTRNSNNWRDGKREFSASIFA
jgi:hypothetical protein